MIQTNHHHDRGWEKHGGGEIGAEIDGDANGIRIYHVACCCVASRYHLHWDGGRGRYGVVVVELALGLEVSCRH